MSHRKPFVRWEQLATRVVLPAGTGLWRIHSIDTEMRSTPPVGDNNPARLFVSREIATALTERYVADLPFTSTGERVLSRRSLLGEALSSMVTTTDVTLAEVGYAVDLDVAHRELTWAQGVVWPSTSDVPRRTITLFADRCPAGVLGAAQQTTTLDGADGAELLTDVLAPYRVRVPLPDGLLVFINYRSGDEKPAAYLLDEVLRGRLGESAVFLDRRSIELGTDFTVTLTTGVRDCRVLLSVIGPRWEESYDRDGRRLLDREDDWVRVEIAEALANDVIVIPVLVARDKLVAAHLPEEIQSIAKHQRLYLPSQYREPHVALVVDELIERVPVLRRHARLVTGSGSQPT